MHESVLKLQVFPKFQQHHLSSPNFKLVAGARERFFSFTTINQQHQPHIKKATEKVRLPP
jgi:hypothetical protein